MMLHVMLAGPGHKARAPRGLCGAAVAGFYFSKLPGNGERRPHLCPVCRSLALKVAPTRHEAACAMVAPPSSQTSPVAR
jgi:hypothetical protein